MLKKVLKDQSEIEFRDELITRKRKSSRQTLNYGLETLSESLKKFKKSEGLDKMAWQMD